MSRRVLISLGALAFLFLAVSLALFFKARRQTGLPKAEAAAGSVQEEAPRPETLTVKLFFITEESSRMKPVVREMAVPEIRDDVYRSFLNLLLKNDGLHIAPVPEGIGVQGVFFLAGPGMLVLDFTESLLTLFPGGTQAELQFVYFIVDNICFNFKEVRKVKFMAGGNEIKTISGHLDMEQPFFPDFSQIQDE